MKSEIELMIENPHMYKAYCTSVELEGNKQTFEEYLRSMD